MKTVIVVSDKQRIPIEQYPIIPRKGDNVSINYVEYVVKDIEFDYDDDESRRH